MKLRGSVIKNGIEKLLSNKFGEWLDIRFMRYTYGHWKNKFSEFDAKTVELALRSKRNVSKHHPNNFQEKVLIQMKEKALKYKR